VWNTDGPDTFDCSGPVHYAMSAPASMERIAARLVLFGTLAAYAGSRAARCHHVAWGLRACVAGGCGFLAGRVVERSAVPEGDPIDFTMCCCERYCRGQTSTVP